MDLAVKTVEQSPAARVSIINAGALSILLPMLNFALRHSLKSIDLTNESEISKLSDSLREHGIRYAFSHESPKLSALEQLLCRAFDAHLFPIPDIMTVIRRLSTKPVEDSKQ